VFQSDPILEQIIEAVIALRDQKTVWSIKMNRRQFPASVRCEWIDPLSGVFFYIIIKIREMDDVAMKDRTHRSSDTARIESVDVTVDQHDVMEIEADRRTQDRTQFSEIIEAIQKDVGIRFQI
jgi:hypothetical protein